MNAEHTHVPIVPRERLDFGLEGDIPRYWMDNDAFKTRFFDAMSTLFPQGEKFFITSVREFKDEVTDPKLQAEVRDFTRQEAQHSLIHRQFNDRLAAQGVDIDSIDRQLAEHFFERRELLEASDPRVRAMYAWHAVEEVEHKAVAFDVLQQVAKVSYVRRILSMVLVSIGFPITVMMIMNHMLQVDGFSRWQRARMWLKGLWWFHKPGGLFSNTWGYYFAYYKPGFHPWKVKEMPSYGTWLQTFEATGDAVAAGNALHAAAGR